MFYSSNETKLKTNLYEKDIFFLNKRKQNYYIFNLQRIMVISQGPKVRNNLFFNYFLVCNRFP